RMENERKIKSVMLGSMDGKGKRGRPKREWLDDIREWCQKDIQTLSRLANEREVWKEMVNCALDTTGNVPKEYDDDDVMTMLSTFDGGIGVKPSLLPSGTFARYFLLDI